MRSSAVSWGGGVSGIFTDGPVPKALIDVILQTSIHAPSGHNMQTWQFTVTQGDTEIQRLKEVAAWVTAVKKVYFYGFIKPTALILVNNDWCSYFR